MGTTLRKQREVRERELRLMEVARGMLVAQGYAGLSMDRLAEATEFSKGTVYQHFSTKEDLVMALARQSMAERSSLFERLLAMPGRPRERMHGIGVADEVFARLYPHAFRSELIIKMADLEDRASDERRDALRAEEHRCLVVARGSSRRPSRRATWRRRPPSARFVRRRVERHRHPHHRLQLSPADVRGRGRRPVRLLRENVSVLLDGFGWKPLSGEWDYAATHRRILWEVFADESRRVGLA